MAATIPNREAHAKRNEGEGSTADWIAGAFPYLRAAVFLSPPRKQGVWAHASLRSGWPQKRECTADSWPHGERGNEGHLRLDENGPVTVAEGDARNHAAQGAVCMQHAEPAIQVEGRRAGRSERGRQISPFLVRQRFVQDQGLAVLALVNPVGHLVVGRVVSRGE